MGPIITLFINRKFNNSLKVLVKASLILMANTQTHDLAQYDLEQTRVSQPFLNGHLVLESGNSCTIINK